MATHDLPDHLPEIAPPVLATERKPVDVLAVNPFSGGRGRTIDGNPLVAGVNKDAIDIGAGLRELKACGYTDQRTAMVIDYALARWARGEEEQAERGAIDQSFHGIDLTSWRRVLAAAMAAAFARVQGGGK